MSSKASIPWPRKQCRIRLQGTESYLDYNPDADFVYLSEDASLTFWFLGDLNGYFTLRDMWTGQHLGVDESGRLTCTAEDIGSGEVFVFKQHLSGGYHMLTPRKSGLGLNVVTILGDGEDACINTIGEGDVALWEFI